MSSPSLEVCLSPALLHLYNTKNKIVVIIDVFRATSTIAAALHNGAASVVPVASVEECINLGLQTPFSITAGERNGHIAPGLKHGNSPTEYPPDFIAGKTLFLTTTNGTRLLHMVKDPYAIVTGAFLNLEALCNWLLEQKRDVILACSAWKDRFNLEDTLFAGAVVNTLAPFFITADDSAKAASHLATTSRNNYLHFLKDSTHYHRLASYGCLPDLEYCCTPDLHPVVPVLIDKKLVVA